MSGFFKGAKIDPKFEKKISKEVNAVLLPSIVLTHPIKAFEKINKDALNGWVALKVEEYLGVEDEIFAGTIVNTMEEDKASNPKKLQHTLEPFLAARAREFMEELWEMMVEAEAADDGIPASWNAEFKAKIFPQESKARREEPKKLGYGERRETRVRSPERVVGRHIENDGSRRDDRRKRYYDRSPEARKDEPRSYEKRGRSRSRSVEAVDGRASSVDTYKSSPSVKENSRERSVSDELRRHPHRHRHHHHHRRSSRHGSRSRSRERRHHKKHHHHHRRKHHHERSGSRSRSPSSGPVMSDLEKMLRQKALESIKNRNTSAILE
jgi:serine/arginine repetitive matrix protein 1